MRVGVIMCLTTAATSSLAAAAAAATTSSALVAAASPTTTTLPSTESHAGQMRLFGGSSSAQRAFDELGEPKSRGDASSPMSWQQKKHLLTKSSGGSRSSSSRSSSRSSGSGWQFGQRKFSSSSSSSSLHSEDLDQQQQQTRSNHDRKLIGASSSTFYNSNKQNHYDRLRTTSSHQQEEQSFASSSASASPLIQLQQQQQQQQQSSFADWWRDYWSRQPFPSGYTQSSITLLACLITTIIFLIVVGNLLVCIAIFTEKSLKPTQNWFIASLAVSDMLLGLIVMPFSLARELMGFWIFGPLWCDIHEAVDVLLTTASINTLCLISLDRYWSITQAVSYLKKRTPRRGALMIAFVWIFSAAVSLPPLFGWKKNQVPIIVPLSQSSFSSNNQQQQNNSSTSNIQHQQLRPSNLEENQDQMLQSQDDQPENDPLASTTSRRRRRRHRTGFFDRSSGSQTVPPSIEDDKHELATPILPTSGGQAGALSFPVPHTDLFQPSSRSRRLRHLAAAAAAEEEEEEAEEDGGSAPLELFPIDTPPLATAAAGQLHITGAGSAATGNGAAAINQPAVASLEPLDSLTTEYPSCQLSDDVGYVLYSALGSFFIPCAVMVFTYIKIFLAARSRARRAINKQSRGGGAGGAPKQRLAARRAHTTHPSAGCGTTMSGQINSNRRESRPLGSAMGVASSSPPNAGSLARGQSRQMSIKSRPPSAAAASGQQSVVNGCSAGALEAAEAGGDGVSQVPRADDLPAMMKSGGKIVIVERKKSLVPMTLNSKDQQQLTSSSLAAAAAAAGAATGEDGGGGKENFHTHHHRNNNKQQHCLTEMDEHDADDDLNQHSHQLIGQQMATLTTSGAKQASPSALNDASNDDHDSSMITVMNASMSEHVPVTRFSFKSPAAASTLTTNHDDEATNNDDEQQQEKEKRKAAALLKAISEVRVEQVDPQLLKEVFSSESMEGDEEAPTNNESHVVPNIVLERRATTTTVGTGTGTGVLGPTNYSLTGSTHHHKLNEHNDNDKQRDNNNNNNINTHPATCLHDENKDCVVQEQQPQKQSACTTTNETCFMTIEEDSDTFDAQAGRTILISISPTPHAATAATDGAVKSATQTITSRRQVAPSGDAEHFNNVICRQRHHHHHHHHHPGTLTNAAAAAHRSGSSFCDSSMTINDDEDDDHEDNDHDHHQHEDYIVGDEEEEDDELLDQECNLGGGADDDEDDDDVLTNDDCMNLSCSEQEHYGCQVRAQSCRLHCSECESHFLREQHQQQEGVSSSPPAQRHLSSEVCPTNFQQESPIHAANCNIKSNHQQHHHHHDQHAYYHHYHHHHHQHQHPHGCGGDHDDGLHRCVSLENHSLLNATDLVAGDDLDNLSHMTTDCRMSQDDLSSSFVGHDVLDATIEPSSPGSLYRSRQQEKLVRKKSLLMSGQLNNGGKQPAQPGGATSSPTTAAAAGDDGGVAALRNRTGGAASSFGERKKSIIGFRLSRLGSSSTTPLSGQSGGLIALAAAASQQQGSAAAAGGATRNLKALRQNFFLKLNQLTAKSATTKQHQQHELKESAKKMSKKQQQQQTMSNQSSATDHDASLDGPTTSALHSNDYPAETTGCDYDDVLDEQPTSAGDSQANTSSAAAAANNMTSGRQDTQTRATKQSQGDLQLESAGKQPTTDGATGQKGSGLFHLYDGSGVDADDKTQLLHRKTGNMNGVALSNQNNNNNSNNKRSSGGQLISSTSSNSLLQQQQQQQQLISPITNGKPPQNANNNNNKFMNQTTLRVANSSSSGGGGAGFRAGAKRSPHGTNHSSMMTTTTTGASSYGGGSTTTNRNEYLASDNERHKRKLAKARERRATLILGLIMTTFICAWMPFFTFYVLRALCTVCRDYISPRFESFIFWMGYCNSAINPIIYTIFNRDFRKAFRKILFKCL